MLRNVLCLIAICAIKVEGELARKLSYAQITGYEPASSVVQHSLIDLDQKEMETHLGAKPTPDFAKAKDIYMKGGNSGGKATITVGALGAAAAKGAEVKQQVDQGVVAIGSMKSAAAKDATSITVSYKSECKEGGSATKVSTGCFTVAGGDITVGGTNIGAPTAVKNSYRTLAGFSTAAKAKMAQYKIYDNYYKYYLAEYGDVGDYANQMVLAALDKKGMCSACDDAARVQIAKKTSAYMNVWMYVVREFEDAIEDCNEGCIDCNDDPVHAWDEGVAFYSGSLEGTDNANSVSGKLIHALADKRCENFKTCLGADGISGGSKVNSAFIKQCKEGQAKLLAGKCKEAIPIKDRIIEIMSVPLIQGSLRYAYKVGYQKATDSKTVSEGTAFSAAILPRVHACDPAAAKIISDNMKEPMHGASSMSDGFAKVKAAFESTYKCMGVTCADVGGLWLTDDYHPEAAPCASYAQITGYEPASSVVQHSLIDLDQKEMETHLGAKPTPDYAKAKDIYMKGGNSGGKATMTVGALGAAAAKGAEVKQGTVAVGSMKSAAAKDATSITVSYKSECKEGGSATKVSTGCFTVAGGDITVGGTSIGAPTEVKNGYRTLAGFSTAAKAKMAQYKIYDNYYKYYLAEYGDVGDYANQHVLAALDKKGMCSACDDAARVQIAKKTSAYMNVWMYVVREFEDAIEDCNEGCIDCNDDPVHAWDEGVAFYSGSLEGTDNANSVSGKLIHALADKRCENFKTCLGADGISGGSKVNSAFIKQCKEGQAKLLAGKCKEAIPIKDRIIEIMSVPLIQGSLRYAYKVGAQSKKDSKTVSEGAAFSAAILPRVHACDPAAAKTISDNMKEPMHGASSMSDGFAKVKAAFESTYKCMGVTCEDIGGLWLTEDYYDGAEPCKSDDHDHDHGHSGGKPKEMCLDTATAQSHGGCMDAKTDVHCYDMGTHKVTCDQACPSGCDAGSKSDDHDDHAGHDHGSDAATAAPATTTVDSAPPTTSASVDLKLTPILGAVLLAQMALLHHA